MRQIHVEFALLVAACVFLVWKLGYGPKISAAASAGVVAPHKNTQYSDLKTDQRTAVLYQLPTQEQNVLLQAVRYFCVEKYQRDSCIHHLITCGVPCMVAIPKPQRKIIFADYQKLRRERGLAPLPHVPHDENY